MDVVHSSWFFGNYFKTDVFWDKDLKYYKTPVVDYNVKAVNAMIEIVNQYEDDGVRYYDIELTFDESAEYETFIAQMRADYYEDKFGIGSKIHQTTVYKLALDAQLISSNSPKSSNTVFQFAEDNNVKPNKDGVQFNYNENKVFTKEKHISDYYTVRKEGFFIKQYILDYHVEAFRFDALDETDFTFSDYNDLVNLITSKGINISLKY